MPLSNMNNRGYMTPAGEYVEVSVYSPDRRTPKATPKTGTKTPTGQRKIAD